MGNGVQREAGEEVNLPRGLLGGCSVPPAPGLGRGQCTHIQVLSACPAVPLLLL